MLQKQDGLKRLKKQVMVSMSKAVLNNETQDKWAWVSKYCVNSVKFFKKAENQYNRH